MLRNNHVRVASTLVDLASILAALICAGMWPVRESTQFGSAVLLAAAHVSLFGLVWLLIANRLGTYNIPAGRNLRGCLLRTAEAWAATWGVAGLLANSILAPDRLDIWLVLLVGAALLGTSRLVLRMTPMGQAGGQRTLVVGACPSARQLSSGHEGQAALNFIGYIPFAGENAAEMAHLPKLGSVEELGAAVRDHRVEMALVSPSDTAITGDVHRVFKTCDELGLSVQYFPSFLDVEHLSVGIAWNESRIGLSMQALPNHSLAQLTKRTLDVVGAAVGVITLLPVLISCAVAIKLTGRGPVFFRQVRVGQMGETFQCLKFRTMRVGAHAQQELLRCASTQDGPAFKIPRDPRITKVGHLLRKFSLDELPQLLNVLLGDMSLVGPRPPIPTEVDNYTWWQRRRISVKPGLTCVWQVYGRNQVSFKRWVEMDLFYIDNWSLWLDLKLIAHTFRAVLRGTGM